MNVENLLLSTQYEIIVASDFNRISNLLKLKYQFDLLNFAPTFIKRRIVYSILKNKVNDVNEFFIRLDEPAFFETFLFDVLGNSVDFFQDLSVWIALQTRIKTFVDLHNTCKIWFPVSGNGEELYTLLLLLHQNKLLEYCSITASNASKVCISLINKGFYEGKIENIKFLEKWKPEFISTYMHYFKVVDTAIQLDSDLLSNVQLVHEESYTSNYSNNFDFVVFRNSMIYMSKQHQIDSLEHVYAALKKEGIITIGVNEQLVIPAIETKFISIDNEERIFQKI